MRSYAEAARDPHVRERDMLQDVDARGRQRRAVTGPAAKFSRTPTRVRSGAPALGAHTDAILAELGVSREERALLRGEGIV